MKLFKNKKAGADNVLIEIIIFVLLNVIVFSMLLFFVVSQSSGAAVVQEQSAKKIALAIDLMTENMQVNITMPELFELAKKNNYLDKELIKVDVDSELITVSVKSGSSYSYRHFSSALQDFSILQDNKNKQIIIQS